MAFEDIFMVRGGVGIGPFNTDFNIKLIFLVSAIILIIYDWKKNKRKDYIWVSVFGMIIWSIAEIGMQLAGVRILQESFLFGLPLPLFISLPIQAFVEGAFIAITCLFFADRMREKETRVVSIIIFTILMVAMFAGAFIEGIQTPDYGGVVPSRRRMTAISSSIFLGILTFTSITFFIWKPSEKHPKRGKYIKVYPTTQDRNRGLNFLLLMLIFGTVWTIAECIAGTRWIEVGIVGDTRHAPLLIEFLALAFDVIIEISIAYLPFYTLPLGLKLIKSVEVV